MIAVSVNKSAICGCSLGSVDSEFIARHAHVASHLVPRRARGLAQPSRFLLRICLVYYLASESERDVTSFLRNTGSSISDSYTL